MASIHLDHVSVDIPIFDAGSRSLRNNVLAAATGGQIKPRSGSNKVIIRAVDDVSLTFPHGARVGLIGHNGAGKSTLLRVLAGIYEPTGGTITVEGEVAAIFDIWSGMDTDASGWENIILRGILLGFSRREIEARSEEIGQFTGLGDFLNMPLRTYSAGMAARLAFSITTSIRSEILLMDEGVGTSDMAFMTQAQTRTEAFIGEAGLLVMASHSTELLQYWCNIGVWMEHGRVRMTGPIREVISAYKEATESKAAQAAAVA